MNTDEPSAEYELSMYARLVVTDLCRALAELIEIPGEFPGGDEAYAALEAGRDFLVTTEAHT